MKRRLPSRIASFFAGLLAANLLAPAARAQVTAAAAPAPHYAEPQLDQLLGPIALYPDPLIALILPAATSPGDIVSAAAYLAAQGNPNLAAHQPWSDSVKGLAHYPVVVEWMAQNLLWTQALGAAFASQPADVMQSIQRLRARAIAARTLTDTLQQRLVEEDGLIEILPTETDVIYVPVYDADLAYVGGYYDGPILTFGAPYPAGVWLDYGFDWRHRVLWAGSSRFAHDSRGWQVPDFAGAGGHRWQPSANPPRAGAFAAGPTAAALRPHPMPGDFASRRPLAPPERPKELALAAGHAQTPLPRPSLPAEARRPWPASAEFRPVSPPPGSPGNSPLYADVRAGLPPGQSFRPVTPVGTTPHPATAAPSAAQRSEHAPERPAPRPAASALPPPAEGKDADAAKR